MRRNVGRAAAPLLVALAAACGELPPLAPLNQVYDDIEFGSVVCPGQPPTVAVVPNGLTCSLSVTVTDVQGVPVANPQLRWTSGNSVVLAASGSGSVGTLTGRSFGSTTLTVADTRGRVSKSITVHVVPNAGG